MLTAGRKDRLPTVMEAGRGPASALPPHPCPPATGHGTSLTSGHFQSPHGRGAGTGVRTGETYKLVANEEARRCAEA